VRAVRRNEKPEVKFLRVRTLSQGTRQPSYQGGSQRASANEYKQHPLKKLSWLRRSGIVGEKHSETASTDSTKAETTTRTTGRKDVESPQRRGTRKDLRVHRLFCRALSQRGILEILEGNKGEKGEKKPQFGDTISESSFCHKSAECLDPRVTMEEWIAVGWITRTRPSERVLSRRERRKARTRGSMGR